MVPLNSKQRRALEALRQAQEPLSAYALLDLLRPHGFSAPTQVYRALEVLIKAGAVHRLETLNAYIACRLEHRHECTVFAICNHCGRTDELLDQDLSGCLDRLAQRRHFSCESITIEVRGTCATCSDVVTNATTPAECNSVGSSALYAHQPVKGASE
ncbi:transcriptional repressor [Halomonas binhaiensis]|uniref:Transcriptional repressor n=1 Tax=Halomonas binhaiensis TaxID=2562282 RepID=A0A856QVR2_9GAMM|nr:transcriptional repressor [Halomonas binhaiensis]